MRYDLSFFLCCCKSFLGDDTTTSPDHENFYSLLGIERDATQDEIKKAYKKQSLQMHPDKLAQRGKTVTEEDQAKFTRMKEAYEVLSDPHKRETYDAIGERGMKWVEEPFSMDPQELAHNFAKSSALDRSKIFAIFVGIAIAVLLLPVLVCLHVDGVFGENAPWAATLTPLWIWDCFILFYHIRVIMMGPISRPDHIPPEEWVDPLPMKKRIFSLVRFVLVILFEILVALKLDGVLPIPWFLVFIPLYIWEASTLYKKWPMARMRIVTVEDLETALGKPFVEFTAQEKELIGKRYSVVPSTTSPEFEAAQKLKARARHDMIKSAFRIIFVVLLLLQIDLAKDWSWWFVFSPFWVMTFLICFANYQSFAEVQAMAAEKDPTLFGLKPNDETGTNTTTNYGAVGTDGAATPDAAATPKPPELSEEEREELKAQVMASASRLCSKCCSQGFLLILMLLFVGKLQGAGFSSLWIISPFLLCAGIILCCLGFAIFGITEVPTDGVEFDTGEFGGDSNTEVDQGRNPNTATTSPADSYTPPPSGAQPDLESGRGAAAGSGNAAGGASSTNITSSGVGVASSNSNPAQQQTSATSANPQEVDLLSDGGYVPERQRSGNSGIHGLD